MRRNSLVVTCLLLVSVLPLASCKGEKSEREPTDVLLAGAFSSVGGEALPLSWLSGATSDERKREANTWVEGALYSREAQAVIPHNASAVERGVLGRALLEHLENRVLSEQPVREEELLEHKRRLWLRFDRPRAVRSVALSVPVAPLDREEHARSLAVQLLEATKGATNVEEFVALGKAVETDLIVETRSEPPLTSDGRVVPLIPQDREFRRKDADYARAACLLTAPGDISEIVLTREGYFILFATEVVPARQPELDEVRTEIAKEVAKARMGQPLASIKEHSSIEIERVRDDFEILLQPVRRSL